VLLLLTFLLFLPLRGHEFINYDDQRYVTENHQVRQGLTPAGVLWAFTTTHGANWHPLTWLSHMTDVQLFGMNPGRHHLVNLLFHLASTALLFAALVRMTGAMGKSALVAALFAVHPLHVESVAWIAERKDVLSTFFWMASLVAYQRYVARPEPRRYLLLTLLFIGGLMSKPMLVTLPLTLLLLDYWPYGRLHAIRDRQGRRGGAKRGPPTRAAQTSTTGVSQQGRDTLRDRTPQPALARFWPVLTEKIPLLALSAVSAVVTYLVQQQGGAVSSLGLLPPQARVANALTSTVAYLGKMIVPRGLAVFYPHPLSVPAWQPVTALLLLFVVSAAVVSLARSKPYLLAGWLWYLVTLAPVLGIVQAGGQSMADRYTYVPLLGLFVALSWLVPDLVPHGPSRRLVLGCLGAGAVAVLLPVTRAQIALWQDSATLFRHALAVTSGNYIAHNNLGSALHRAGKVEEARGHFVEALRIAPWYTNARNNLALLRAEGGRDDEALADYTAVLRDRPAYPEGHFNLANLLVKRGDDAGAVPHYAEAVRLRPEYAEARVNWGNALARLGKADEALAQFRKAVELKPDLVEARLNLGNLLLQGGRAPEAVPQLAEALRRDPGNPEGLYLLGNALVAQGAWEEAALRFSEALQARPGMGEAHNNLGFALAKLGRPAEAEAHYREALRINPRHVEAHANLGNVELRQGRYELAADAYRRALEISPAYPELHFSLGFALEELGRREEAAAQYREALALRPGYPDARTRLDGLAGR
jgi:tetratricopeptide (TPR) repeat protein